MPNKDADTKNSPKEELLEARGIPAEADNTSIEQVHAKSSIPDPELAALLSELETILNNDIFRLKNKGPVDMPWAIGEIMQLITKHHNALIDKVLGLLMNENYPKLTPNSGMYNPEMITRNKLRSQLRAEVEKLKEE